MADSTNPNPPVPSRPASPVPPGSNHPIPVLARVHGMVDHDVCAGVCLHSLQRRCHEGLRDFPIANAVYVTIDGTSIASNVYAALHQDLHKWTGEEINDKASQIAALKKAIKDVNFLNDINGVEPEPALPPPPTPPSTHAPAAMVPTPGSAPSGTRRSTAFIPLDGPNISVRNGNSFNLAALNQPSPRQLTDLAKSYNDGVRFGRDMHDILDLKLLIFKDCCVKAGFNQFQTPRAFSIMLKCKALNYYGQLRGDDAPSDIVDFDGFKAVGALDNNATLHAITKQDPHIKIKPAETASQFSLEGSYGTATFPGVLPDNGTSEHSTAGQLQVFPLQRIMSNLEVNATRVPTPLIPIAFHVMPTNTPFLYCLHDMDTMEISGDIHGYFSSKSSRELSAIPPGLSFADYIAISATPNVCEHCQLHAGQPKRFRFTLRSDHVFDHEVLVWIIYLDGIRLVLHVVDSVTGFNAACFLKDLSAQHTWDALRMCWIDAYQGPHDFIPIDAGINFRSCEFKRAARTSAITAKEVLIEAHHDIGKVERYHATLCRAYDIICAEDHSIPREQVLQMTVKTINDTAGPNDLISTLLVFSAPSPGVDKRAEVVQKTTDEPRRTNLTLRTPNAKSPMLLPSATARGWPVHASFHRSGELYNLPRGPKVFRSTHVKPFLDDLDENVVDVNPSPNALAAPATSVKEYQQGLPPPPLPYRCGRPRMGEERPKPPPGQPRRISRRRISTAKTVGVKPALVVNFISEVDVDVVAAFFAAHGVLLTNKEHADLKLATQLRKSGKITTPGRPFEQSDKVAVKGLIDQDILRMVMYDPVEHASRLVIQVYVDNGKEVIYTQSQTIQPASQRLIVAIAHQLLLSGKTLWFRDITQVFIASIYGIPEVGTHWWAMYSRHHREVLQIDTSSYDPCLLISSTVNPDFAVTGIQTDHTLGFTDASFSAREDQALTKASVISIHKSGTIVLRQKGQGKKLALVDVDASPDAV
ncbi:hypothetical protein CcaCcLH18_14350 [Colletotrichum camelliae]|nr:hypothetical protein CcaCcLH18_14350 [Colletotrichum camelliae]